MPIIWVLRFVVYTLKSVKKESHLVRYMPVITIKDWTQCFGNNWSTFNFFKIKWLISNLLINILG